MNLKKKLTSLRNDRSRIENDNFVRCNGSRKVFGIRYRKDKNVQGSHFPTNLRPSRRNRPHSRSPHHHQSQSYQITPEDLESRNPINLTDKNLDGILREGHKSLLRKGSKFCPTPTKQITSPTMKVLLNIKSQ